MSLALPNSHALYIPNPAKASTTSFPNHTHGFLLDCAQRSGITTPFGNLEPRRLQFRDSEAGVAETHASLAVFRRCRSRGGFGS